MLAAMPSRGTSALSGLGAAASWSKIPPESVIWLGFKETSARTCMTRQVGHVFDLSSERYKGYLFYGDNAERRISTNRRVIWCWESADLAGMTSVLDPISL